MIMKFLESILCFYKGNTKFTIVIVFFKDLSHLLECFDGISGFCVLSNVILNKLSVHNIFMLRVCFFLFRSILFFHF